MLIAVLVAYSALARAALGLGGVARLWMFALVNLCALAALFYRGAEPLPLALLAYVLVVVVHYLLVRRFGAIVHAT